MNSSVNCPSWLRWFLTSGAGSVIAVVSAVLGTYISSKTATIWIAIVGFLLKALYDFLKKKINSKIAHVTLLFGEKRKERYPREFYIEDSFFTNDVYDIFVDLNIKNAEKLIGNFIQIKFKFGGSFSLVKDAEKKRYVDYEVDDASESIFIPITATANLSGSMNFKIIRNKNIGMEKILSVNVVDQKKKRQSKISVHQFVIINFNEVNIKKGLDNGED